MTTIPSVTLSNPNQSTTEYVVDLNKQLLKENQNLIASITRLEEELKKKGEELEEKEDELGREETKNNYLKGLLKNFLETSRMYQKISDNRKSISDFNYKCMKDYKKKIKTNHYILLGLYFALFSISFITMEYTTTLLIMFYTSFPIGILEYDISIFNLPIHKRANDKIKGLEETLKKVETSQDYIHEFIDGI